MDDAVRDLLIVVGLLIAAGIFWLSDGGIEKAKYRMAHPEENVSWISQNTGSGTRNTNRPGGSGSGSGSTSQVTAPSNPFLTDSRYASTTNKSAYFKQVQIRRSNVGSTDAQQEYLELVADRSLKGRVPISGWKLTSAATGGGVASLGNVAVLPRSSVIQFTEEPLRIAAGETVIVNTGRSPIGVSFLTNKCIGYYNQFNTFNPSLNSNCPRIKNEARPAPPNQLKDACLDFIDSWPACRTPLTAFPEKLDHYCREYVLKEANYERCVDLHKNDADFFGTEWRVYLRRNDELWKNRRETIELRDDRGMLVDSVSY